MPSWWRPDRFAKKRETLEARAKIFAALRGYFARVDFIEVDTPALHGHVAMEPHLTPFATDFVSPHGDKQTLYLVTSPEINCKKLLVAGMPRIYQLSHVFRNAEMSRRHHPEFTLLEWYRVGAGYDELMHDCEQILRASFAVTGKTHFKNCNITQDAERLTVVDAFLRYADMDILATLNDTQKIMDEARRIGVRTAHDDHWDDVALRILGEKIEPHLGFDRPCFLMDYPLPLAALARAKPSDSRVAERFELYVCGLELANAFVELTDAKVQRARFEADMKLRELRYGKTYPIDDDFLNALEHGMPEAAGIAMGVDRLVMLATGAEHIDDVVWVPF
jgi:elongation factor P--(R)-beta-lysine ligase